MKLNALIIFLLLTLVPGQILSESVAKQAFPVPDSVSESVVQRAFSDPASSSRPWCFWYWMYGCVSKEGIKADLQAMHDIGLEGAYLMPIRGQRTPSVYEPALDQLTPEWWDMVRFALEEAGKQQLKLGMHICDGFALAGGPWIKPEQSMQQVVWTKTLVKGGVACSVKLPQPKTNEDYYKDIAVFAYPTPPGMTGSDVKPVRITSSDSVQALDFLVDYNGKDTFRSQKDCWIQYEYQEPFLCRSIVTKVNGTNYQCHRFKVEVSHDGIHFQFVAQLDAPRHGWQNTGADVTHAIPPTQARFFRFHWTKEGSLPAAEDLDNAKWAPSLKLTGLFLSTEPTLHQFESKNASVWRISPVTTGVQLPATLCVPKDQLKDITSYLAKDGRLTWKAPKGNWTILRIGHTSTGMTNATGGAGTGLECDKFCQETVQLQFDKWFGKACETAGSELVSKVLNVMHIDSWECGCQNWSETFPREFEKRRGYSLVPYLPVMAGVPVSSVKESEQILYDVRQTISELIRDVFFKTMVEAAHAKGCTVSAECVAPTMMSDGMYHFKTVDIPMGEFWYDSPTHDKPNDMLDAVSGAHVYGKKLVQAEGFTQLRTTWTETPATHKALLDRNFALGVNKMVFHVFVHNPFLDRKPGMTLDGIGLFFQRDQTWWKPAKAWIDYITRCQSLLQFGHPVVDIAVFSGLELPRRAVLPDRLIPFLPGIAGPERVASEAIRLSNKGVPMVESPVGVNHTANLFRAEEWVDPLRGYAYDSFNSEVLYTLADSGKLTLPDGASYRLLLVPQCHPLSPETITPCSGQENQLRSALTKLIAANVPVLTPPALANELKIPALLPWKDSDFSALGLKRDFDVFENGVSAHSSVAWTHRANENVDIYFIANQQQKDRYLEVTLRVAGRMPELYNPLTGKTFEALNWSVKDGRTSLWLEMAPYESLFIVFEKPTQLINHQATALEPDTVFQLDGSWTVRFDTCYGGPSGLMTFSDLQSWSVQENPAIRYYSGSAVYSTSFRVPDITEATIYRLDLGCVADIAEVYVNGIFCGTVWTAPYRADITKALKEGQNELEIHVTNTWANRMEGDALLPENERITWTDGRYRKKYRTLLDAGLLGPVRLESVPAYMKVVETLPID